MSLDLEKTESKIIVIKRADCNVTEVRETPQSKLEAFLVEKSLGLRTVAHKLHLADIPVELKDPSRHIVLFSDFKASPEPEAPAPKCFTCHRSLRWEPGSYSFGSKGNIYLVPEIGMWECSKKDHLGAVHMPDFDRYRGMVKKYNDLMLGHQT
ncbi:MAG: hypothetical protein PHQ59_05170 [Candidatus Daviesbacteria bacterium]|nr:hypothetical protein [Candidatus Daviesbacteria bacterium]